MEKDDFHPPVDPLDPFSEIPTLGPQQALLRSGAELGRYSLVRELGRGGMGVVWLARDRELGGRPVALKFLPEVLAADTVAVAALRREAETMLTLTHPGIVRLLTLDSCQGLVFLVMEYLAGPTLRQVLGEMKQEEAGAGLTPAEALWVLEQVAPALDHAHGEGVLHRDLKPGNLLLDRAPKHPLGSGRERLKVADFGIAYVASTSFTQLTGRPHTSGTLPYMAPEVLLGGVPSRAGDIYALGATLFELVAGVPPFHHGDISRQITDVPAPPLRSGDAALDAAVAAALSKDPKARPTSAEALLALARGVRSAARGAAAARAAARPRHRGWLAAATLAVLAAAAGGLAWRQGWGPFAGHETTAPEPVAAAPSEPRAEPSAGPPPAPVAPKVSLTEPKEGLVTKGKRLHVAGRVEPPDVAGLRLTATTPEDALPLRLDAEGRFNLEIPLPGTDGPATLRILDGRGLVLAAAGVIVDRSLPSPGETSGGQAAPALPQVEVTLEDPQLEKGVRRWFVRDPALRVRGRVQGARSAVVHVRLDEDPLRSVALEGGRFEFQGQLQGEGSHSLEVQAEGLAEPVVWNPVLDTQAPSLRIVDPETGTLTREKRIRVEVEASDVNLNRVEAGGVVLEQQGQTNRWSGEVSLPREGKNRIEAAAEDKAGNDTTQGVVVTRDTQAPGLKLTQTKEFYSGLPAAVGLRFDEPVTSVKLEGKALSVSEDGRRATGTLQAPERAGPWKPSWQAKDVAGNEASGTLSWTVVNVRAPKGWKVLEMEPSYSSWAHKVRDPRTGITFILVGPGTFRMGSPAGERDRYDDEGPVHEVEITKPFYLGETEVTQAQWQRVMGSNPSYSKGDDLPVEQVSWEDAMEFCRKAGYRLPTEAEWEYACRAGSTTRFSFGDVDGDLGAYAWYEGNSENRTHPVGQKKPNAWGFLDMHGNVWEWCADRYAEDYYGRSPRQDPQGPSSGSNRVLRGGSWDDDPRGCRSASRYYGGPSYCNYYFGLRVARTP